MRIFFIALLSALTASLAYAVDLDQPGALAIVKQETPEHYAKIERILAAAERVPAFELPGYLPMAVGAKDVFAVPLLMVSYPPKTKLAFTLDETRYDATVVVRFPPAELKPIR